MEETVDLERFFARLSAATGAPPLAAAEAEALLELARVVAHQMERRFAPLTTYVVGLTLDPSLPPDDRTEHVRGVIAAVQRLVAEEEAAQETVAGSDG